MDKIVGKDEMANSDGVINHKLVFSDDAVVVDYLNHLLASTQTTTSDSGEIHFVHMPTWSGLEPVVPSNTFVDNSLVFGIDHSKIAIEGLRKENETLKFKTELAEIDSQVLRGENDILKEEISYLTAQRNEMKSALDAISTQKNDLLTKINFLQSQRDLSERNVAEALQRHAAESFAFTVETATDHERKPEPEPVVLYDGCSAMTEQEEEPSLELSPLQEIIVPEIAPQTPPSPAVIVHTLPDAKKYTGIDQDTAFISRTIALNNSENPRLNREPVVFSRRPVAFSALERSPIPASTLIKQHDVKENHRFQNADQSFKIEPLSTLQPDRTNKDAVQKLEVVHQQHIAEPEIIPIDAPITHKDMLHSDEVDGIDLEPAQAPTVIVRKNVKNYMDLQKETDPDNAAKTAHAIIL